MSNFDKMKNELLKGGNAGAINKVVNSAEGKKIGSMVDGNALKKAVTEGDNETINRILGQVLATEEGKTLAKRISESFGKK